MTRQDIRRAVLAAAVIASANATGAHAQMGNWGPWGWTVYGTGEYDSDKTGLALGGLSLAPTALGWVPLLGIQGHYLRYAPSSGTVTSTGFQPYLGVQKNFGTGLLALRGGYQFEGSKAVLSAPTTVATGDGFVLTGQLESWGTGTEVGGQGLATYNFGSETFWGRGRVDMPLTKLNPGAIRLGVEAAFLNVGKSSPGFSSTSVGPILLWQTGRGVNMGFAAGKRFGDSDATYFRVDVAIFPQK